MALPSLTLRTTKGSALTYAEADANFTNLSTASTKVLVGSTTTTLALNDTLTLAAGANVTLTADSASKTVTITAASGGMTDIVTDTTPQLGGDLDVNGKKIVSTANAGIYIEPNGTGDVYLTADQIVVGDLNSNATITTYGSGDLILNTDSGNNSGSITIPDGANQNITIAPNGSGRVVIDANTWPATDGTNGQIIVTDGTGNLKWVNSATTYSLTTATAAALGGIKVGSNLTITGDGTLSATATALTTATAAALGGVKIGANVNITGDGTISVAAPYSLNTATASVLGGVKIGSGLSITGDGTISATAAPSLGVQSISFGSTGLTPSSATTGTVLVGGVLNVANGGLGTSEVAGVGRIPIGNGSNYVPAFLTAGSGIAITTGSGTVSIAATGGASAETVYAYTFSATFAPNWTNGTIQTTTITANITSLAFTSPVSGQTITIVATQGGSGSYTLPASSSTLKYANATRSLSTAVGAIDLITISYIGTVYYVSVTRGFA